MNNNWQENKWLYDKTYTKRPKDSMLRMAPVHVYSLKNPQAVKGAVKAQPGPVRASVILPIAGIALVWALNILFGYLMFITGDLVTDSLIFSAVIGIIGFLFYRRSHAYDDMAREIERNATERKAKGL